MSAAGVRAEMKRGLSGLREERDVSVHLRDKFTELLSYALRGRDDTVWTACGRRCNHPDDNLQVTADPDAVTCGSCKRSREIAGRNADVTEWMAP